MTDISKVAVEAFIQGPLKEAVLSEGMPRNTDCTKDVYAAVDILRALSARIEQLEAEREALIVARDMMGRKWSTARKDALRDVDEVCDNDYSLSCPSCAAVRANISALINKEPTT